MGKADHQAERGAGNVRDAIHIPDNVKRIAKEKGLRLADIEKAAFVSVGYISRLKKSRVRGMSAETLLQLSKVLEVTIDELLEEPPAFTNADKFKEVFGFVPNGSGITSRGYTIDTNDGVFLNWDDPYEDRAN